MGKNDITIHGMLHDDINYKALIKAQAKTPSFLDTPKDYETVSKNYENKPKTKKLSYNENNKDKIR